MLTTRLFRRHTPNDFQHPMFHLVRAPMYVPAPILSPSPRPQPTLSRRLSNSLAFITAPRRACRCGGARGSTTWG